MTTCSLSLQLTSANYNNDDDNNDKVSEDSNYEGVSNEDIVSE